MMRGYKKTLRLNWLPRRFLRAPFIGDSARSFIDTIVTTFRRNHKRSGGWRNKRGKSTPRPIKMRFVHNWCLRLQSIVAWLTQSRQNYGDHWKHKPLDEHNPLRDDKMRRHLNKLFRQFASCIETNRLDGFLVISLSAHKLVVNP